MGKKTYRYKIVLLGPGAVGKTSTLHQFVKNQFKENYTLTIGAQFLKKEIKFKKDKADLILWDMAGQKHFKTVRKNFYTKSNGALLIFDLTRYSTFEEMQDWLNELNANLQEEVPFILIGNKLDLIDITGRSVPKEEAEGFAKERNSLYIETSAKTGENVEEAFTELVKLIANAKGQKIK